MIKSEVVDDLKTFKSLDALNDSEGGKLLIKSITVTVKDRINELTAIYKTASHIELVSIISDISAHLDIYSKMTNAKENKKAAKEVLDNILTNETN